MKNQKVKNLIIAIYISIKINYKIIMICIFKNFNFTVNNGFQI